MAGAEKQADAAVGGELTLEDGDESALGCEGEAEPFFERPGEGIIGYVV